MIAFSETRNYSSLESDGIGVWRVRKKGGGGSLRGGHARGLSGGKGETRRKASLRYGETVLACALSCCFCLPWLAE